jgi:hypothetical protein
MIDLTEDHMLGMARIAGPHPDEDVVPLTLRLNAPLEASEALTTSLRTSWLSPHSRTL